MHVLDKWKFQYSDIRIFEYSNNSRDLNSANRIQILFSDSNIGLEYTPLVKRLQHVCISMMENNNVEHTGNTSTHTLKYSSM